MRTLAAGGGPSVDREHLLRAGEHLRHGQPLWLDRLARGRWDEGQDLANQAGQPLTGMALRSRPAAVVIRLLWVTGEHRRHGRDEGRHSGPFEQHSCGART